jgi:ABC-type antimicrobial peptide transport system permease subunit
VFRNDKAASPSLEHLNTRTSEHPSTSFRIKLMRIGRLIPVLALLAVTLLSGSAPVLGQAKPKVDPKLAERYRSLAASVDSRRINDAIRYLSSFPSRIVGYPGDASAAEYVQKQFQEIGLEPVYPSGMAESFTVTVPIASLDNPGSLEVGGHPYTIHPLWPNLVRTSQLPKDGLHAPMMYAGTGKLSEFNGRDVEGSIVLVEFNSASDWLNAPRLGAKAVVFVEPSDTMRGEVESKFLSIPVAIPRFWISKRDAAQLIPSLLGERLPTATMKCDMRWEKRPARNFLAKIEGSDPVMKDQIIVLEAYYDAMSMVPTKAPGAENACSISAMLEIARALKQHPPKRTVWFLATSAHFIGLQGIKAFLSNHIDEFTQPSLWEKFLNWMFSPGTRWVVAVLLLLVGAGCLLYGLYTYFYRRPQQRVWLSAVGVVLLYIFFVSLGQPTQGKLRAYPHIYLFAGLDLSSQSKGVGLFYKAHFYDYREDIQNKFSDIARVTRENSEKVALTFGLDAKQIFADGVNPIEGKNWRNFLPGRMALDSEVWTLAGARGVSFASVDDSRNKVDTPFDTASRVNVDNIAQQTKVLACLIDHILQDTNSPGEINVPRMPISEASNFTRMGLQGGFATVKGRVVKFDLKKSFIPSIPVPESLAVMQNPNKVKTFMGVRGDTIQLVNDEGGTFEFNGVPPLTTYGGKRTITVQAYHIDENGDIDYAPDLGHTGAKAYPIDVSVTMATKEVTVILFKCISTSVYDFVDPQVLKTLSTVNLYDGATNAEPRQYGMAIGKPEQWQPVVEDAAVFFAQPGFSIKVIMGAGPAAIRFVLINSTPQVPEGIGYKLGAQLQGGDKAPEIQGVTHNRTYEGNIPNIPLTVAKDMWTLDDFRIKQLAKYRIINEGLNSLHARSGELIKSAEKAIQEKNYARLDSDSRGAWGYEARAYPDVQKTARDVVKGVMFYLALLLPFSFFSERLFFAFPKLQQQITGVFGIFIAIFIVFRYIHPAFDITMNPLIVLLAFIMLALSTLVIVLISGKFEQQLKEFNKTISGVHKADIGRMSIAAAAFSLGISNMRRRKARTVLTCITLVLLTFIVLSFTSVVSGMRFNIVPSPGTPRYNGIMLRTAMWEKLEESSFRLLNDEFGEQRKVAPRAWFFGAAMGEQTFLTLSRGDRVFNARAIMGMTPEEDQVTRPSQALIAGRWLGPTDVYTLILPKEIADALGVSLDDVNHQSAFVRYGGVDYRVVGVIDNDSFKAIKDLDQEPLTPVDFILMQKQTQSGGGGGGGAEDAGFREYTHLEPNTVFIMPYQTLMNLGGDVRGIAINFLSQDEVTKVRKDLMPRLGLNLYAGEGGHTFRYSSIGATSIAGAGTLFIPILIAALIVLNTMLGSVFERQKEIGIFSAIGLAPNHVAMLFMAEAMVYAILGAIAGYVLGQGTAKIIVHFNLLQGLNLNFSSVSAVFSTSLVMATVLLSTLYPARKASEVATPAIERTWKTPEPNGDEWQIPLPFAVTGDQATGLNGFLSEWFKAYEEYSIGDFVTQNVETSEYDMELGKAYQIRLMAWLAPFDLGVSQEVVLDTMPTDMEDVFELRLTIHRHSGDISNWKRVNRRFLNTLRKQFLIWRTLRAEDRERYFEDAEAATGASPAAAT